MQTLPPPAGFRMRSLLYSLPLPLPELVTHAILHVLYKYSICWVLIPSHLAILPATCLSFFCTLPSFSMPRKATKTSKSTYVAPSHCVLPLIPLWWPQDSSIGQEGCRPHARCSNQCDPPNLCVCMGSFHLIFVLTSSHSVAVTVPPTPRPKRVSPKKLATPSDAPAVQIRSVFLIIKRSLLTVLLVSTAVRFTSLPSGVAFRLALRQTLRLILRLFPPKRSSMHHSPAVLRSSTTITMSINHRLLERWLKPWMRHSTLKRIPKRRRHKRHQKRRMPNASEYGMPLCYGVDSHW